MKKITYLSLLLLLPLAALGLQQGNYFAKKTYEPLSLPGFDQLRAKLPQPICQADPLLVETYWKAWETAFRNFHAPTPANGFVSQYIDAAFNNCIFLWDTAFMTMFCNYASPLVPGIASLDNFYAKQYPDGEICREINRTDGSDCPLWVNKNGEPLYSNWGYEVPARFDKTFIEYRHRPAPITPPVHTLDNMNHPIMAWAEVESFMITGDKARLRMVYPPLQQYYNALKTYLRQGNGLYMTDWAGMDNSARNILLKGGGTGIDISCEMALFARNMAFIAANIGQPESMPIYLEDAGALDKAVNEQMWNDERGFYFDLTLDGRQTPVRTVAAYWSLISNVATPERAAQLAALLADPKAFGTPNMVPSLAADEPSFSSCGDYWCGSVWAPTTMMVIRGLEKYGFNDLAAQIAMNHIRLVANVYKTTGSIWENYSPMWQASGRHADGRPVAKDFVGWSGIGPIALFLEYGIGLKPTKTDGSSLEWSIGMPQTVGCGNYRFGGNITTLVCEQANAKGKRVITVTAEKPFTLTIKTTGTKKKFKIKKGRQTLGDC